MDMFAFDLSFTARYGICAMSGALIRDKIVSEGGEFSRDISITEHIHPSIQCEYFASEIDELNVFPEQFER